MKRFKTSAFLLPALLLAGSALTSAALAASSAEPTGPDPHPKPQLAKPAANAASLPGATWESIAKLPDWFGPWSYDNRPNQSATTEVLPTTPKYTPILANVRARATRGEDVESEVYHCHPRGVPPMMISASGAVFNFVFVPGRLDIIPENSQVRHIYTDGRGHPADVKVSFNGHSIGKWEANGTILNIDTVAIHPDVQLFYGMPGGGKLTVTERMSQILPNKIQIVTAISDPNELTKPWGYTRTYTQHKDWQIAENYCAQNNRDVDPNTGGQTFNLEPPPAEAPPPK